MKEELEERFDKLQNIFCLDLAQSVVNILSQFPEEYRLELTYRLQDKTSLFSPYTADAIERRLNEIK